MASSVCTDCVETSCHSLPAASLAAGIPFRICGMDKSGIGPSSDHRHAVYPQHDVGVHPGELLQIKTLSCSSPADGQEDSMAPCYSKSNTAATTTYTAAKITMPSACKTFAEIVQTLCRIAPKSLQLCPPHFAELPPNSCSVVQDACWLFLRDYGTHQSHDMWHTKDT